MILTALDQTRGGQTCAIEESLAENQKPQPAAKSVFSVKYSLVKNANIT